VPPSSTRRGCASATTWNWLWPAAFRRRSAEVKAGATVRTEDLAGLRNLASHLGDKFVAGYVLYTGQQTLSYGGRIKALPIDALWFLAP